MQETKTLKLNIFEDSDYPSFAPINENFNKIETSFQNVSNNANTALTKTTEFEKEINKNTNDITELQSNLSNTIVKVNEVKDIIDKVTLTENGVKKTYKKHIVQLKVNNNDIVKPECQSLTVNNSSSRFTAKEFTSNYYTFSIDAVDVMGVSKENYTNMIILNTHCYQDFFNYQGKDNYPHLGLKFFGSQPDGKVLLSFEGNIFRNRTLTYSEETGELANPYYPQLYQASGYVIVVIEYLEPVD